MKIFDTLIAALCSLHSNPQYNDENLLKREFIKKAAFQSANHYKKACSNWGGEESFLQVVFKYTNDLKDLKVIMPQNQTAPDDGVKYYKNLMKFSAKKEYKKKIHQYFSGFLYHSPDDDEFSSHLKYDAQTQTLQFAESHSAMYVAPFLRPGFEQRGENYFERKDFPTGMMDSPDWKKSIKHISYPCENVELSKLNLHCPVLSSSISDFRNLESINMEGHNIHFIPPGLESCPSLQKVSFHNTSIEKDQVIGLKKRLSHLTIEYDDKIL